jgi:cyclopropane fatty-acyl-phospholipid synthase-like methyltransferase
MITSKPFTPSCEKNKAPILAVLLRHLADSKELLEIGSGTGQHAVHMAAHLPKLRWHTSELAAEHAGICAWLDEAKLPNLVPPAELDTQSETWPVLATDAVYTANTCHIMSWKAVQAMFAGVARILNKGGLLLIYGPFNYDDAYTSPGNEQFDHTLRARGTNSGIRDFEAMDELATLHGMALIEDAEMPANNRMLIWRSAGS